MSRPPNLLLLITDQQRAPMHWPEEPGWLDALTPTDAELRRTGVSFERAFTATCMCSPSRASFLTGTYPSRHGVDAHADLRRPVARPANRARRRCARRRG